MTRLARKYDIVVLHIIFFITLLAVYLSYIVDVYGYEGYLDDFNSSKLLVAMLVVLVATSMVRKRVTPSHFFLHLTLALVVTPSMVMYCGANLPNEFALLIFFSFFLMALCARAVNVRTIDFVSFNHIVFLKYLAVLSILFVLSIFAFGGAHFINFDITLVYDIRDDAENNLPGIYGYLTPIFSKIIVPFAIIFALIHKNWIVVLILAFCSILIFALTAHKAPIFYPFIVVSIYLMGGKKNLVSLVLVTLIFMLGISEVDFWLAESTDDLIYGWVGNLLAKRSILNTTLLNWFYFDFFSEHKNYYWSQSSITFGLADNPYKMSPELLIGQNYFPPLDRASPNTGWIGSGFANSGYIGTFIYSVIIGCLFSFLDAYAKKIGERLVIAMFTIPVLVMICASDFLAVLLTHGLVVSILLLMCVKPLFPISNKGVVV
jgi:hypothetical protein